MGRPLDKTINLGSSLRSEDQRVIMNSLEYAAKLLVLIYRHK